MSKGLLQALELYESTFDDGFPTMSVGGMPDEKMIEIINKCVKKKKDVYELGYLSLDENILY